MSETMLHVPTKSVLHLGCGRASVLESVFPPETWREVRVDENPAVSPDFLLSADNLAGIGDETVDAVYTSHMLEHLWPTQAVQALYEARRVLKRGGRLVVIVPDMEAAAQLVLDHGLHHVAFQGATWAVTVHQIIFGDALDGAEPQQAHRCGFTPASLTALVTRCGFGEVRFARRGPQVGSDSHAYDIVLQAVKPLWGEEETAGALDRDEDVHRPDHGEPQRHDGPESGGG